MTGAGSRVAANSLFKATPDGLVIGNFIGSLVLQQIMGDKGIEFDARKFEWLGAPVQDETVCALTKASGINSLDEWFAGKKPVKLGGEAPGRERFRCAAHLESRARFADAIDRRVQRNFEYSRRRRSR